MIAGTIQEIIGYIKGKPILKPLQYTHPENWDEITWLQYCEFVKLTQENLILDPSVIKFKMLPILTGIPGLSISSAQEETVSSIEKRLDFLFDTPNLLDEPIAKKIEYNGESYFVPRDLETRAKGQMFTASQLLQVQHQDIIDKNPDTEADNIPLYKYFPCYTELIANFVLPWVKDEIDRREKRVKQFAVDLEKYPAKIIMPLGYFFFLKTLRSKLNGAKDYKEITQATKGRQGLRNLKSLARFFRFTR